MMYELRVERGFCAAHAITIAGRREAAHGHNWGAIVTVAGPQLDENGLLCDFHLIEKELDRVIGRFHNQDLNQTAPFDRLNPTAENVVRHISDEVAKSLPKRVRLISVSVTEAPGCAATYRGDGA